MISKALSYIRNIKTTGAVYESSRYVSKSLTEEITPTKTQIVVELGGGSGNITAQILAKLHPDSKLYCFEIDPDFFMQLQRIKDPRFHLIQGSAAEINQYFQSGSVDIIISGLPLSLFSDSERTRLLVDCYSLLKVGGVYRQFLYSVRKKYFSSIFDHMETGIAINFPPAILYSCYRLS